MIIREYPNGVTINGMFNSGYKVVCEHEGSTFISHSLGEMFCTIWQMRRLQRLESNVWRTRTWEEGKV